MYWKNIDWMWFFLKLKLQSLKKMSRKNFFFITAKKKKKKKQKRDDFGTVDAEI
jgi:hypothetical protein